MLAEYTRQIATRDRRSVMRQLLMDGLLFADSKDISDKNANPEI
jgi:hypothetical protein